MAKEVQIIVSAKDAASGVFVKVGQGAEGLGKSFRSLGTTLSELGTKMSLGITLPLTLGLRELANAGLEITRIDSMFRAAMGDMAASAENWAQRVAGALAMDNDAIKEALANNQLFLDNMGLTGEGALQMSESLIQAARSMSLLRGVPFQDVMDAYQKGIMGTTRGLKSLGISVDENLIKQTALDLGIMKQGETLSSTGKALATYAIILDQSKVAEDNLGNSLGTLYGKTEQAKAEINNMKDALARDLLPAQLAVLSFMQPLIKTVSDLAESFGKLPEQTQKTVFWLLAAVAAAGPLMKIFTGLKDLIMVSLVPAIKSLIGIGTTAAGSFIAAGRSVATASAMAAGGIAIVAGEILWVGSELIQIASRLDEFGFMWKDIWMKVKMWFFESIAKILDGLSGFLNKIGLGGSSIGKSLKNGAASARADLKKATEEYNKAWSDFAEHMSAKNNKNGGMPDKIKLPQIDTGDALASMKDFIASLQDLGVDMTATGKQLGQQLSQGVIDALASMNIPAGATAAEAKRQQLLNQSNLIPTGTTPGSQARYKAWDEYFANRGYGNDAAKWYADQMAQVSQANRDWLDGERQAIQDQAALHQMQMEQVSLGNRGWLDMERNEREISDAVYRAQLEQAAQNQRDWLAMERDSREMADAAKERLLEAIDSLAETLESLAPKAHALGDALAKLKSAPGDTRNWTDFIGFMVSNSASLSEAFSALDVGLQALVDALGSAVTSIFGKTGSAVLGGAIQGAQIGSVFGPIGTAIGALAGALLGGIGSKIQQWQDFLESASIGDLLAKLQQLQSSPGQGSFWDRLFGQSNAKKIAELIAQIKQELGIAGAQLADTVKSAFSAKTVADFTKNLNQSIYSKVRDALVSAFLTSSQMMPLFNSLSDAIANAISDGVLSSVELNAIKGIVSQIDSAGSAFYQVLDGLGLNMEALGDTVNSVTEALTNVPQGFKVALARFNATDIPAMATGGYVPATPGGTIVRLGEGGESEVVTPLSKIGRGITMVFQAGSVLVHSPEEFYSAMKRLAAGENSRNGGTSINAAPLYVGV